MTDHLSSSTLNALADGELSQEELAVANEHLGGCSSCTSNALYQSLLKTATAKAGQRYAMTPQLQERLTRMVSEAKSRTENPGLDTVRMFPSRTPWRSGLLAGAIAAVLILFAASVMLIQRTIRKADMASAERATLVNEILDQHIAMLAGNLPPQVISTDRHTVKPWFQGKLSFSFNLPEHLPKDTTLDGANLTYLQDQPVAQLLYSIGRHRVSVFVREKSGATEMDETPTEHSGFHVVSFSADNLEVIAISDVDPARLAELVSAIRQVQAGDQK